MDFREHWEGFLQGSSVAVLVVGVKGGSRRVAFCRGNCTVKCRGESAWHKAMFSVV